MKVFHLIFLASPTFATVGDKLNEYDHFSKPVTTPLLTGGRLISRHLSYLASAGVNSVVSLFPFNATDEWEGVSGDWLSSDDEVSTCESLGMDAVYFDFGSDTFTPESVQTFSETLSQLPTPTYVHCHVGWTADLFTHLHLVLTNKRNSSTFYTDTLKLGWDFQSDVDANALVEATIGLVADVSEPSIELDLAEGEDSYMYQYWSHRLGDMDGYYNIGQILDTQVDAIATAGYKSVISFRGDGETTTRLWTDPAEGPIDNHEFSDNNGNWNATLEQIAFEAAGIAWYYAPVTGDAAYDPDTYYEYEPIFEGAVNPVLVHCRSGYRAAIYTLTYLGSVHGFCASWAIAAAAEVGFHLNEVEDADAINLFEQVLGC